MLEVEGSNGIKETRSGGETPHHCRQSWTRCINSKADADMKGGTRRRGRAGVAMKSLQREAEAAEATMR